MLCVLLSIFDFFGYHIMHAWTCQYLLNSMCGVKKKRIVIIYLSNILLNARLG